MPTAATRRKRSAAVRLASAKSQMAYAIVCKGEIDLNRIEAYTEEGRESLIRSANRPAGESVKAVGITIVD